MNKQHRNYFFPPYPTNIDWSKAGTSDSYKYGHSVAYIMCDCKIGKDHETGSCLHCQPKEKQCCHGESVCLKCITEKHNCNLQSLKIDQKFLDKTAKQHNKDYPKEYWNKSIKIDEELEKILVEHRARECGENCPDRIKSLFLSLIKEVIGENDYTVYWDSDDNRIKAWQNELRIEQRSRAKALGLDIEGKEV